MQPARSERKICFKKPLKFQKRFIIETDMRKVGSLNTALLQAVGDCVFRKAVVVLFPGEPFLLRRSDNSAIMDKTCCRVVVEGGYSKYPGIYEMTPCDALSVIMILLIEDSFNKVICDLLANHDRPIFGKMHGIIKYVSRMHYH